MVSINSVLNNQRTTVFTKENKHSKHKNITAVAFHNGHLYEQIRLVPVRSALDFVCALPTSLQETEVVVSATGPARTLQQLDNTIKTFWFSGVLIFVLKKKKTEILKPIQLLRHANV